MSEKNINEINQSVETNSALKKSPKYVAAIAGLSLMTQVQAQQVLEEVKNPLLENNKSSLVVDSCEKNINTDVISIQDSDGKQIAKTLERDEQPELTQYNLSDLSIVSNYDFEDKMYLHGEQTMTVTENHPGSFSNIYDVSSFYTSNHVGLETPCEPGKDGQTVDRWEQKLISFDSMNDRDKELYFRVLNTVFLNAKINHTGGDLPDNMSRNKLEHIVTGISSFATRQLSIPNVNTEIKQPLEISDGTISKYNLNIITELAYVENLLKGSKPKIIDRGDGVFYAIPDMSQNFMDFLATKDVEGNQFITTEQINSILAVVDQLNHISVVEAAESIDYADVQEEYVSYFKNARVSKKYKGKISQLKTDVQYMLLESFLIGSTEIGGKNASDEDKHFLVLGLYKIYNEVNKGSGEAMRNVGLLLKDFPKLVGGKLDQIINITSKQADHYEYEMSAEDAAELARLQENIQRNRQIIAQDNQIIAQDNQIIAQDNQIIAQDKKHNKEYERLNKVGEKIKIANNN